MEQSEHHFQQLIKGNSSPQLKKSLQRLKAACNALNELKAEISVTSVCAQIQHIFGTKQGPTAGAIRNDKARLLEYIKLRRAEQELPPRGVGPIPEYEIPSIVDEKVRSYVTLITNQNRQLRNENNRLKGVFKALAPIDMSSLVSPSNKELRPAPEAVTSLVSAVQEQNIDWALLAEVAEKFLNPPPDFYLEIAEIEGEEVLRMRTNKMVLLMPKHIKILRYLIGIT